jgi:SAM-dependent methyltransferase
MADSVRISCDLALAPSPAFARVIEELTSALARLQIDFEPGPGGGVTERGLVVGEVVAWEPGHRAAFRWRSASWDPGETMSVELRVDPSDGSSTITVELRGLLRALQDSSELAGWFASEALAPVIRATSPRAFGDWFTDRYARRPSGAQARATYADPLYHYPNFRAILSELDLRPDDYLVEVGCGGGALLKAALASGCRAAAIDHSPEMVRLARQANASAVAEGRLTVLDGDAASLPFGDATFTCAAMTGVLGFLRDPVAAFAEIRRVLAAGGRFVCLGSDPELRGTPGAPEPMASRLRFYEDGELEQLGRAAGFSDVRVERRDLEAFAREAGVPEEHIPLFAAKPGEGARFLICRHRDRW